MTILVTGGMGVVGSELARQLIHRGEHVVLFVRSVKHDSIGDIEKDVELIYGDLGSYSDVLSAIKSHKISSIFHLGAMLGARSEEHPSWSFQSNVIGTMNILEAASLFDIEKVLFTSTIGVYNSTIEGVVSDSSPRKPTGIYGIQKLYCELMGVYYRNRFGIDYRAVRYPAIIAPGSKISYHVSSQLFAMPALGKYYEVPSARDTEEAIIYYKDAAGSLIQLHNAPSDRIKTVNYNLVGPQEKFAYREMEQAVKKIIPDAQITYAAKPTVFFFPNMTKFDDDNARNEWGWTPSYATLDSIAEDFIKEIREHPGRHGR